MTRNERPTPWRIDERRSGFTLIELLFVLLVISTMATMAVPPMLSSQRKMRIDAAVQQLTLDLARARSEAVKRNESVTLTRTGSNSYTVAGIADQQLDGVTFEAGSDTTITFASYGTLKPVASRTMVVRLGSETRTVAVSSAGFPRVR